MRYAKAEWQSVRIIRDADNWSAKNLRQSLISRNYQGGISVCCAFDFVGAETAPSYVTLGPAAGATLIAKLAARSGRRRGFANASAASRLSDAVNGVVLR